MFGDALNPALGFLPRPGTRQYEVYVAYQPRPTSAGLRWARQFFYQVDLQQVDDLHGNTQTRRLFTAPFNVDTESGEHFEFDWIPDYEALTEPFEIVDGVTLPVGHYHFNRYRFEAQSSDARPWRIGDVVELGDFYTGRLTQTKPFVNWTTLDGKLRFELSNETDFGHLPQGNFIQRLYQLKVSYSFSPDLNCPASRSTTRALVIPLSTRGCVGSSRPVAISTSSSTMASKLRSMIQMHVWRQYRTP